MALDVPLLTQALAAAGYVVTPAGDGLRVEAETAQVGQVAADKQIVLTDLRAAGGGLEELFLKLTADTQRESVNNQGVQA